MMLVLAGILLICGAFSVYFIEEKAEAPGSDAETQSDLI